MPPAVAARPPIRLSTREFERLGRSIRMLTGTQVLERQRPMLESRLLTRIRELGLDGFEAYLDLMERSPIERAELVHRATTHMTSFFREPHHFDLVRQHLTTTTPLGSSFRVWSAASSTGEEAYSLAMVVWDAGSAIRAPVEITATDVDPRVVERAKEATYPSSAALSVPPSMTRHLLAADAGRSVRVTPELRSLVRFGVENLTATRWGVSGLFDVVMCRNVLIYFDAPTQHRVLDALVATIRPGGLLVLGHSENGLAETRGLSLVGPTAYRTTGSAIGSVAASPRMVRVGERVVLDASESANASLESGFLALLFDPVTGAGVAAHLSGVDDADAPVLDDATLAALRSMGARAERLVAKVLSVASDAPPTEQRMARLVAPAHLSAYKISSGPADVQLQPGKGRLAWRTRSLSEGPR